MLRSLLKPTPIDAGMQAFATLRAFHEGITDVAVVGRCCSCEVHKNCEGSLQNARAFTSRINPMEMAETVAVACCISDGSHVFDGAGSILRCHR